MLKDASPLAPHILFDVAGVPISRTVVTTWAIMAVLSVAAWLGTRRLSLRPGRYQLCLEILVETIGDQIRAVIGRDPRPFLPLLGTLFVFLVTANLTILVPGASPPTADIATPAALAAIVFVAVHYFGVRARGARAYLKHYAEPNPLLLPLNVLSEITRTFSLMIRLFGNIMSHEFVIGIVVVLAGLFVPIPFMALGVLIGIIQAYIFTILATVFIGAGVGSIEGG
jgi:F-type H+-transporting ATPase subunit a